MMKRGAIFDMDGLMIDTERVYQDTWEELAADRGLTLDESFPNEICGTVGEEECAVLRKYFMTEDTDSLFDDFRKRIRLKLRGKIFKKPGITELLHFLKEQGMPIIVASSSSEEEILHLMEATGLMKYLDDYISGVSLARAKPFPDIFLKAAERIGLPASDCYVFEDSFNGIRAGRAAGAYTVMIPDILQPDEEMRSKADAIFPSLLDVLEKMKAGEM